MHGKQCLLLGVNLVHNLHQPITVHLLIIDFIYHIRQFVRTVPVRIVHFFLDAQIFYTMIISNGVKPGGEIGFTPEIRKLLKNLAKDILNKLLCEHRILQKRVAFLKYFRGIPDIQDPEEICVVFVFDLFYELNVGKIIHRQFINHFLMFVKYSKLMNCKDNL